MDSRVGHGKQLNVRLMYMMEAPLSLLARALKLPLKLVAAGDAAVGREPDDKGLPMRKAV